MGLNIDSLGVEIGLFDEWACLEDLAVHISWMERSHVGSSFCEANGLEQEL